MALTTKPLHEKPITGNQYRFQSPTGLTSTCLRDEAAPYIAGGYGGWQVVNRMRRTGLTQWVGRDPVRVVVPALFDGWESQEGQEIEISNLERMALPALRGGEPPPVRSAGS